ncbi:hypothetical protein KCU62_g3206, partial [Aureobasidium sp. EXF-3399]
MPAPAEDISHITGNDHSDQWPFNEPPNLVRHVPRANGVQETEIFVKDESSVVDILPQINHALRREYARSWGTPQVRRGELAKIKFAVNYEKGESRLVKHEVRRRGGKIVRISQADVLVVDRQFLNQVLSNAGPSGVSDNADGPMASTRPPSLARSLPRAVDRISQAQANYEDLIAQEMPALPDADETRAIEQDLNNEERSFRPPSPAVPPIMEEVASDGYASSCDEHEIHRAIIHSTKRMKPAKVKKGFLIQVKMVLRGPNGATVNAVNGKPGVTRTLRVPAVTSFRQLTDVLNTAFGWIGDGEWDYLIATNAGKWSNVEPPPWQFIARVLKIVTRRTAEYAVPDEEEAHIRAREIRLFDVWGRHQPRQCQNLQVWYNYHSEIEWAHQISFLGEANDRLFEASRMEEDREYWCIAGEGHAHPEDHPGNLDKWRKKTNLWAWDMAKINKELAELEESSLHR